jgi:hypothetical protein
MSEFKSLYSKLAEKGANIAIKQILNILVNMDNKLDSIEDRLIKLQESKYHSGISFLEQASKAQNPQRKKQLLIEAANELTRAPKQADALTTKALAHFFCGCCNELIDDENEIAADQYIYAFKYACEFEFVEQSIINKSADKINTASAAIGAISGGAAPLVAASSINSVSVALALAISTGALALPVVAGVVAVGAVVGASPFVFTRKTGDFIARFKSRKHLCDVDSFFYEFTVPLSVVLVNRNIEFKGSPIALDISNRMRPKVSVLESYLNS